MDDSRLVLHTVYDACNRVCSWVCCFLALSIPLSWSCFVEPVLFRHARTAVHAFSVPSRSHPTHAFLPSTVGSWLDAEAADWAAAAPESVSDGDMGRPHAEDDWCDRRCESKANRRWDCARGAAFKAVLNEKNSVFRIIHASCMYAW